MCNIQFVLSSRTADSNNEWLGKRLKWTVKCEQSVKAHLAPGREMSNGWLAFKYQQAFIVNVDVLEVIYMLELQVSQNYDHDDTSIRNQLWIFF